MINIRTEWTKALPTHWVVNAATLGPIGDMGKAPGTLGSIVGLIWYTIFFYQASPLAFLLLMLGSVYLAIAFCGEAEVRLGKHDPGEIILDEMVAVPLCFLGAGYLFNYFPIWLVLLVGFVLFRFFDIVKPFGIKKLQRFYGGVGVVVDDLAAGLWACVSLHAILGAWLIFF